MKKIDWTSVTASNGLVFEEQTFEHMNNGHKDSYISFVKANIPSAWHTGKLVILYGCVSTGTNPGSRTLTSGAVYYNDEIYQVDSASFTTTGSQIGVWTLTDVDSGTDESTIKTATSSFLEHVLVNSKFVFSAGLSGSGTFDETSTNIVSIIPIGTQIYVSGAQTISSPSYTDVTGMTYTTPNDGVTRKYAISYKGKIFQQCRTSLTSEMYLKLYNSTDNTTFDESFYAQGVSGLNTGSDAVSRNIQGVVMSIQSIAPNKTIKVAAKETANDGVDNVIISESKLLIQEIG